MPASCKNKESTATKFISQVETYKDAKERHRDLIKNWFLTKGYVILAKHPFQRYTNHCFRFLNNTETRWYEINLRRNNCLLVNAVFVNAWTNSETFRGTDWHRRVKNRCYSEGRGHSDDDKHILAVARESCRNNRSYDVASPVVSPCRECSPS